jgi:Na+-driven multidrug efflux pump
MLVVPFVYWGLGFSTAVILSSTMQLGVIGFWYAFVLALTVNALILIARFAWVSRPAAQAAAMEQSTRGPILVRPASGPEHG